MLADARRTAYSVRSARSAWAAAGIWLSSASRPLRNVSGAARTPSPPAQDPVASPKTPRNAQQVDSLVDSVLDTERSPELLKQLERLARSAKRSLLDMELLLQEQKELREASAPRPKRRRRIDTTGGKFFTPEKLTTLRRHLQWEQGRKERAERQRAARKERLASLQERGMLLGRRRCPPGRLVILPAIQGREEEDLEGQASSDGSTGSDDAS